MIDIEMKHYKDLEIRGESIHSIRFIDCTFEHCTFEDVTLHLCIFLQCKFHNCTIINPYSEMSELNNTVLSKCNLIGVPWGIFTGKSKHHRVIDTLNDSFLKYCSFNLLSLQKIKFESNRFQNTTFESCDLKEASFKNCIMDGTSFTNSNLVKADFREAKDYHIDIFSNKLKGARFSFPDAIVLLDGTGIIID